jgi:hypothetical protein
MKSAVPVLRTVVCVFNDLCEHGLWFEHQILLWNHVPGGRKNGRENTKVEKDGAIGGELKGEEQLGLKHRHKE